MESESAFEQMAQALEDTCPALAIEIARKHLASEACDPYVLLLYSGTLMSLARYDDAEEAARRALSALEPGKQHHAFNQLGHVAKERGDLAGAVTWFSQAIAARPHDAGAYIFLGAAHAQAGRFEDAEVWHRKATACADGCIDEAWLNLGYVLRARRQYAEAAACFRKTLELDPDDAAAKAGLRDVENAARFVPSGDSADPSTHHA